MKMMVLRRFVSVLLVVGLFASPISTQATGKFWHVTDFHWDLNYTQMGGDVKSMCWSSDATDPQTDVGQFGNYACDSPWTLVMSTLNFMATKLAAPDFIVWTGDDDAHVSDDFFSSEKVVNIMANLTYAIQSAFPNTPVIPVFGNHDAYPKSQFPVDENSDMYVNVANLWRNWLGEEAYTSFQKGGYYTKPHPYLSDLVFIGLNTPVYYNKNSLVTENDLDPLEQLTWLDATLTTIASNSQKAYIIAHIPPGMFGRKVSPNGQKWFRDRFNQLYLDLIVKHAAVIIGQFYGHDHTDSYKIYYDSQGTPVNVHFASPAITPWNTTLAGIGPNNPGVRLFSYDTSNGQLLNYEQYFLNLSLANVNSQADWQLEYDFLSAYDLPDLSYAAIDKMTQTFGTTTRTYFDKYYLYNSVSYSPASECDSVCQRNHYCGIVDIDYNDFVACNNPSPAGSESADHHVRVDEKESNSFRDKWRFDQRNHLTINRHHRNPFSDLYNSWRYDIYKK